MRILVFGTFDHLHPGHCFLLDEASKRGELFVVVALDINVERFKGKKPDQSEVERQEAIQKAYPQATVLLGDSDDYLRRTREIQPDLVLLGYDQQLPAGVTIEDFPCPIERLPAFHPEKYKSSLLRGHRD